MQKEIPRINFDKNKSLGIEVMDISELLDNLNKSKDHDPFSAHRIEFFLILIITQNSYTHYVDFNSYKLIEGSALFVAKNQVHHFTEEIHSCNGFCIIFRSLLKIKDYSISDRLKLDRLFNYHLESPLIHQKEMGKNSFIGIGERLHYEYHFQNNFAKTEILNAMLQVLLLEAERAKKTQTTYHHNIQWLDIFNKFKDLLESDYSSSRNSRGYAVKLFVSYKHLNHIVKTFTGKTAKAFIDDFVIVEVKRYLISTSLSVKEISYKTGFEEPSNFVKFFKKHANTTPLKFKERY